MSDAKGILESNNYTYITFSKAVKFYPFFIPEAQRPPVESSKNNIGFYIFFAYKDSKEYAVAVDIMTGEIAGEVTDENDRYIQAYMNLLR